MASVASDPVWYVYGVVSDDGGNGARGAATIAGLDDASVQLERAGGLAAVVSTLDPAQYAPAALEANTADVEWLGPRAIAHDRVLTWMSEHGSVVPLPMFSVFSGRDAVRTMLRDRAAQLEAALARVGTGREYALRVYRIDAELLPVVGTMSARIRGLEEQAAAASTGQRYLLERKLDAERKNELHVVSRRVVDEIMESLTTRALNVVHSPIPRVTAADAATTGTMVLNDAFLIAPDGLIDFQRALTALVEAHGQRGFRFDFTGPWPPYHFVTEGGEPDAR